MSKFLPNFLIIGAQKAGTTSLYFYLSQHPQIFMSRVKEPHFFTYEGEKIFSHKMRSNSLSTVITDFEDYVRLFQDAEGHAAIGEASPSYIYSPKAPQRIKHYLPEVKIIAVLRNPVDRAYSNFIHCLRNGIEPLSDFQQALEAEEQRIKENWGYNWHYRQKGYYYSQLQRYYDLFPSEKIHVYLYEELKNDPHAVLKHIFQFLGVDGSFSIDVSRKHNVSGIPKNKVSKYLSIAARFYLMNLKSVVPDKLVMLARQILYKKPPPLPAELRKRLIGDYRNDILALQDLIKKDLSGWLNADQS